MQPGDLLQVLETLRVPTSGNSKGDSAACFSDDLSAIIDWIAPGTPVIVLENPQTRFIKVLGPRGPVWMMKNELKHS